MSCAASPPPPGSSRVSVEGAQGRSFRHVRAAARRRWMRLPAVVARQTACLGHVSWEAGSTAPIVRCRRIVSGHNSCALQLIRWITAEYMVGYRRSRVGGCRNIVYDRSLARLHDVWVAAGRRLSDVQRGGGARGSRGPVATGTRSRWSVRTRRRPRRRRKADEQGDNSSPSGALPLAGLFQQLRIPEILIPIYRDAAIYE